MKTTNNLLKILVLTWIILLAFTVNVFSQNTVTINGKLVSYPEPPPEFPCYDCGWVFSILKDDTCFITTIDNEYAGLNYFGTEYGLNDSVKATGLITEKQNCLNQTYYEIELQSIEKLASAPGLETIKGIFFQTGNPAVGYPVLPGIAWYIATTNPLDLENMFLLTTDDFMFFWALETIQINGYTFREGDSATVTGYCRVHYNIHNMPYNTISIGQEGCSVLSVSEKELSENIVNISPNPNKGVMQINSQYYSIESVSVYNINGKLIKSVNSIYQNEYKLENLNAKGVLLVKIMLSNKKEITKKIMVL